MITLPERDVTLRQMLRRDALCEELEVTVSVLNHGDVTRCENIPGLTK
jgi:hypothetical protein